MLLSPAVLEEWASIRRENVSDESYSRLRDAYTIYLSTAERDPKGSLTRFADALLESFVNLPDRWWQKRTTVDPRFVVTTTLRGGRSLRPDRVLLNDGDLDDPRLVVLLDPSSSRLGVGRSQQTYADLIELLRGAGVPFGLLSNGAQFRLVYAGIDFDCSVEWEISRWFEDEDGREQLGGFAFLCGRESLLPKDSMAFPLLTAVRESRNRQGDLSQVLGEQTRRAVELLLGEVDLANRSDPALLAAVSTDPVSGMDLTDEAVDAGLYQAAVRLVMRVVVTLFAEARHLLPLEDEVYFSSYSIEGLFADLQAGTAQEGEQALASMKQAWPRMLALFRLIEEGSDHPDIAIPAYGGALFARGDCTSPDVVRRALALFEDERLAVSDGAVLALLRLLKTGRVKVRMGRQSRYVAGAVDFADLRTEYIGMIYEGLLDYELRTVRPEQEAVVFLDIGVGQAMPFSLLRGLSESDLRNLLTTLDKEKTEKVVEASEDAGSEDTDEEESGEDEEEDVEQEESDEAEVVVVAEDRDRLTLCAVLDWAVQAEEMVNRSRRRRKVKKSAVRRMVRRDGVFLPGQRYLVRSTGARKGSGTFYTKPALAVPTVHRTLEPLVYTVDAKGQKVPRTPEEILALKVADPAMGSGSFLVAALRYLTDALYTSLWYHDRIRAYAVVTLPFGAAAQGTAGEELFDRRPEDDGFETMLRARLARYVVERCIYGVDINPLAVELAKLSLWVETMDRSLPFEFLDHKLKVGNSFVGCWFDQFTEYPLLAWLRKSGDEDHCGVHHEGGTWAAAIKGMLRNQVKPELVRILSGQQAIDGGGEGIARKVYERVVRRFETLHALPLVAGDQGDRERFFHDCIIGDPDFTSLRAAFDRWCAIWFWPADALEEAPTPASFFTGDPAVAARIAAVAAAHRFFHWELEFPEVFVSGRGGFDAVVGNPPW